ncbi:MAG: CDP-alcohol phosphatidyltransferase family protein [bacterium]
MIPFTQVQRAGWIGSLLLTLARLALAPAFIACAVLGAQGWILALMLIAGFVSDVLDGVVARRYNAITPFLRRLDSSVDTTFYLAVAYSAWRLYPRPLRELAWPIAIVIAGEAANYVAALIKFRREPSYHAWSAKLWGLLLFVALATLFGFGGVALLRVALLAGVVAQFESLAITIVLPAWQHDVPSIWHARQLRLARDRPNSAGGV